jgi:hypothetical protein
MEPRETTQEECETETDHPVAQLHVNYMTMMMLIMIMTMG